MKKHLLLFLTLGVALLLASCATYQPAFVLSLHEFDDPQLATRLNKQVRNSSREWQYTIKKTPFLEASSFLAGEVYGPNDEGLYGLRLQIDLWHKGLMREMATANLGNVYAVVVDGTYIGTSHFSAEMRNSELLVIDPLWNLYDATKIVENLKDNQSHFNNWHTKPFQR